MAIIDHDYIEKMAQNYEKLNAKLERDTEMFARQYKELSNKYQGLKEQFLKLDDVQQKCLTYIQTMIQASDYSKEKIWAEHQVKPQTLITPEQLKKINEQNKQN